MDRSPRRLAKAIPFLASALAAESILALTPPFTGRELGFGTCMGALIHVPQIAILLGLVIGVFVMGSRDVSRIASQRLLYGAAVALGATALARFVDLGVYSHVPMAWVFLQAAGSVLLAAAAPGLWGCAWAREEDLPSERIRRLARILACVSFGGLAAFVVSDLVMAVANGPVAILGEASLVTIVSSLFLLLGRGCLLWVSIDSWRPSPDEIVARERCMRSQRLMIGWLLSSGTSWTLTAFFWNEEAHGYGAGQNTLMLLWHGVVQATLSLLAAILVARAIERPGEAFQPRPKGRFFPEPPPPGDTSPIDVP
jgi:hypothetical protein